MSATARASIHALTRTDAHTIERLTIQEREAYAMFCTVSESALNRWLDTREALRAAEDDAENARELQALADKAERRLA